MSSKAWLKCHPLSSPRFLNLSLWNESIPFPCRFILLWHLLTYIFQCWFLSVSLWLLCKLHETTSVSDHSLVTSCGGAYHIFIHSLWVNEQTSTHKVLTHSLHAVNCLPSMGNANLSYGKEKKICVFLVITWKRPKLLAEQLGNHVMLVVDIVLQISTKKVRTWYATSTVENKNKEDCLVDIRNLFLFLKSYCH